MLPEFALSRDRPGQATSACPGPGTSRGSLLDLGRHLDRAHVDDRRIVLRGEDPIVLEEFLVAARLNPDRVPDAALHRFRQLEIAAGVGSRPGEDRVLT